MENLPTVKSEFIAYMLIQHQIIVSFVGECLFVDLLQGENSRLIASTAWDAWIKSRDGIIFYLPEVHQYDDGESKTTRDFVYVDDLKKVIEDRGFKIIEP